ncbi:condensation domain-containing protein, partial [Acinetobacter baumannii]
DEQDWSGRETYESDLAAWRDADVAAGFDLAQPPLFRLALFHRPDGDADLIWTNHHALTDGWSGAQLLGEVNEGYRARRAGRPP